MSTLTWKTEKQLQKEIKNNEDQFSLQEKCENFTAVVRKWPPR